MGHNKEEYYKKQLVKIKKMCGWQLGAIINKIGISNPIISLINFIGTPPTYHNKNTLAISDSGINIYQEIRATTKVAPVIISNDVIERLPDRRAMESSHIVTLQLPGLSKQARKIRIFPKMKTAPLISLGV